VASAIIRNNNTVLFMLESLAKATWGLDAWHGDVVIDVKSGDLWTIDSGKGPGLVLFLTHTIGTGCLANIFQSALQCCYSIDVVLILKILYML
jgi:hypothetical protein